MTFKRMPPFGVKEKEEFLLVDEDSSPTNGLMVTSSGNALGSGREVEL
jgi:hypothetical protein